MAFVFTPLHPSLPAYASAGVPFSPLYGDVYHAVQGAVEQARHVFLGGNDLPARWRGRERFTVCETGFGMGLNFLTLWNDWREDAQRCRRLHVVSIEAHPFSREHLTMLLAERVPASWRELVDELLAQWPPLLPGLHRLDLDGGAVTLTLAFGFAQDVARQLTAQVDAFFLDGFSPSRNPDMWSPALIKGLARLAMPGATAATWSCAGTVRRALRDAGFSVEKRRGFGFKRTMTAARYEPRFVRRHAPPPVPVFAVRHALVVGAGIAGANVAYALALRGWRVTVLDAPPGPDAPDGGEEHLAAAVTPLVAQDDNARARLTRAGALRARQRWAPWIDGDIVSACGTVQEARSDEQLDDVHRTLQILQFPPEWVRPVTQAEASDLAGLPLSRGGAFFPGGLRVRPKPLCEALLAHPSIRVLRQHRVERLRAVASPAVPAGWLWRAFGANDLLLAEAEVAIVANAMDAPHLLNRSAWPQLRDTEVLGSGPESACKPDAVLGDAHHEQVRTVGRRGGAVPDPFVFGIKFFQQQPVAGQITFLPENGAGWGRAPACIVAGDGYVLPAVDGFCVTGSTYDYDAALAIASADGHGMNIERAAHLIPALLQTPLQAASLRGWAGWRAVVPGGMPVVAPLPGVPGLWVTAAYASRGLTWSALAGDLVAATLEGEPLMLERNLLAAIAWR